MLKVCNKKQYFNKTLLSSNFTDDFEQVGEVAVRRCFAKSVLLNIFLNSQKKTCARKTCAGDPFWYSCRAPASNFIKKEIPVQISSCELCKIFKSIFFEEHLRVTVFLYQSSQLTRGPPFY